MVRRLITATEWTDYNTLKFESDLYEMERKFKNVEAIKKEITTSPKDFIDVKRLTITNSEEKKSCKG